MGVDFMGLGSPNPRCDRMGHDYRMVSGSGIDATRVEQCQARPCEVVKVTVIKPMAWTPEPRFFNDLAEAREGVKGGA